LFPLSGGTFEQRTSRPAAVFIISPNGTPLFSSTPSLLKFFLFPFSPMESFAQHPPRIFLPDFRALSSLPFPGDVPFLFICRPVSSPPPFCTLSIPLLPFLHLLRAVFFHLIAFSIYYPQCSPSFVSPSLVSLSFPLFLRAFFLFFSLFFFLLAHFSPRFGRFLHKAIPPVPSTQFFTRVYPLFPSICLLDAGF